MSRYNTQVLSSIRMLCRMQNIDEKVLYERAKLILSIYREVCWSTIDRANDVCDTLAEQLGVAANTIARIETGNRGISIDLAIELVVRFETTLDYIFLGRE